MTIIVLCSVDRLVDWSLRRAMLAALEVVSPAEIGVIAATAAICWTIAEVAL